MYRGYLAFLADSSASDNSNSLLVVMGGVLVALITSGFAYLSTRAAPKRTLIDPGSISHEPDEPSTRMAVRHYTALVLWMALHHPNIDTNKIKTGYEKDEEVRRAV